ncbi:hypothetical protein [Nonlabens antarcticus]|uniref:hypothetical protein n=1 Tax=Nonlabens antarcticus TaxID=392714 RepID=UPI0018913164|nr:hypothetical protein [Nonlabens antarcticus]
MKDILTLGIQMAQSDISVDQARDLGIIGYLTFIKVKAEQQRSQANFSNHNLSLDTVEVGYNSLNANLEELIHEMCLNVRENKSIVVVRQLNYVLLGIEFNGPKLSWEIIQLLENVYFEAKTFIVKPSNSFMNKIAAVQSLGAIATFKNQMDLPSVTCVNSVDLIIDRLIQLRLKPNSIYKMTKLQSA